MSNRTLVDIKKILKEYKIPTSLNKPELLLILDTVEKLKEKGESEDKIKEEGYKKYSEVRKSVKGVLEATGAVEKKIEVKEVKKDATIKYKEILEDYRKGIINFTEYTIKTVSVLDGATKVQEKIIKNSYKTIIENLNSSDEENELNNSFLDKKISAEEYTEKRGKLQKKQEKNMKARARKEFELEQKKLKEAQTFLEKYGEYIFQLANNTISFETLTIITAQILSEKLIQEDERKKIEALYKEARLDRGNRIKKLIDDFKTGTISEEKFISEKNELLKRPNTPEQDNIEEIIKKKINSGEELTNEEEDKLVEMRKKLKEQEQVLEEQLSVIKQQKKQDKPVLLSQDGEEEKQNLSEEEKQNLPEEEKQNLPEEEKQNEQVVVEEPVIETPNDILAKQKLLFELFSRDEISPDEYMQKNEELQNTLNKLINKELEGYVNEPLNSTEKYIEIFKKFKNGEIDKEEFKKLASQILLFADDLTEEDKTILKEDIAIEEDINKKNEKLLDMIEGFISEFQNGKIKEEEIIKKIEIINDDSELVQDEKELLINRLQKVVDDKREETQKSINEIQDIINSLQPIVSQYDNGFINKELFETYVDERLVSVPERQKKVIKIVLDQFSVYKEKEYENIKTEENKELENSIRVFDEQNVEKVLQDRITQERYEGLNVPYKTVDAIEDSDPPTGTVPMVQILNEDQPVTVDPNLPINMQPEPVMRSLDPEVVGGSSLVPKVEESIITGPTNTMEVLTEINNNLRGGLYAQNDTNQALGDIAGAVNNVSGALNDVVGAINNASSVVSDNAEPPAEPPIPPIDTVAEPLVEESAPTLEEKLSGPPLKVEITYEVKYHKFQVNEFFGSIDNPDWDLSLNKSITGNYDNGYYTKDILLEQIAGMISDKKLKIYKQATTIDDEELDILIEYAIVSQLHFCVLRNLQRGNRTKTAMVPLKSLIDLRNTVANSNDTEQQQQQQQQPTTFQSTPTEPAPEEVPNVLKRDITIKDISEKFTDRKYRGNVILYDNVYKNIVKSGHEHSGGNNVIFGPSNLNDPLGLMEDFVNPYKNPKYIIKTTIK